jgi:hypothetical protein
MPTKKGIMNKRLIAIRRFLKRDAKSYFRELATRVTICGDGMVHT